MLCLVVSCIATRTRYLHEALNLASEQEVQGVLGTPKDIYRSEQGNTEWRYRIRAMGRPQGGTGGLIAGDPYCDEYRLTFDASEILRHWERDRC
jgi:hypothetical protein